jgi:hypothetical protein
MIICSLIAVLFLIGFAYIVLSLSNKEAGNMKLAGQIIAVLVALVAVLVLFHGITGRGKCGPCGGGMMEEKGMKCEMMDSMKKDPSMMKDMMKNKEMKHKSMMKTVK